MNRKGILRMILTKEKFLLFSSVALLFLSSNLVGIVLGDASIPRTHHAVTASLWGPATVDPAWVYDTASGALIMNVYSTLVNFYVNHSLPADQKGRTDQFEPDLATEWQLNQPPIAGAPAYVKSTYYFKIREGVHYHDSAYGNVTPSDIEYSFERCMAFDRSGGPSWMIYEPLLGVHAADWGNASWATLIDNSVESNATHVWFNLAMANYPPIIFMQVVAQSWAGIMPKAWAADHYCWPGETYTNANMSAYYDPTVSPLDDWPQGTGMRVECGSGPYTLGDFDAVGHTYRLDWFPDYYAGWPYVHANHYGYQGTCGYAEGWIKTFTFRGIDEWTTRKTMFLTGDCDFCYVPRQNLPEMVVNWAYNPEPEEEEYPPGIICYPGLPTMQEINLFPVRNITVAGNPYIGDGDHLSIYETGIPYWFFNDTHTGYTVGGEPLRKAFAYCFNWTEYIEDVFMGEAIQPSSPQIKGNAYWQYIWDVEGSTDNLAYANGVPDLSNPDCDFDGAPDTLKAGPYSQPLLPNGSGPLPPCPMYYINITKATELFQAAWDGEVWVNGFTFTILYSTGNTAKEVAARMLEEVVEAFNPKFHIDVLEVDWPTYLGEVVAMVMPFFILGRYVEYCDPHNWFYAYMHSHGALSQFQAYADPAVDAMIEAGVTETDDNKRIEIYWKLGNKYFEDVVSFPLVQPTGRHWERTWMEGWYSNPIYPGTYLYHLWKGYRGDVNHDYVCNMFDITIVGSAYDSHPGDGNWEPCADVDNDGYVGLYDYTIVLACVAGPEHDVAVTGVTNVCCEDYSVAIDKTVVCKNQTTCVNVTVTNEGDYTETTSVALWAENVSTYQIGSAIPVTLTPGDSKTVTLLFSSADLPKGNYTVFTNVTKVSGEAYTADNTRVYGWIFVAHPGDLDCDNHVFLYDLTILGTAWDSRPGDPTWNANADIDGDCHVFLFDLTVLGTHWDEYG